MVKIPEIDGLCNASCEFAQWLTTYIVPVRDIVELLDISPQRVSQLANE